MFLLICKWDIAIVAWVLWERITTEMPQKGLKTNLMSSSLTKNKLFNKNYFQH